MVVLIHVPKAVATKSVGENAAPFPLLSAGASVGIFDFEGPWVASQCKLPVYFTEIFTITDYRPIVFLVTILTQFNGLTI